MRALDCLGGFFITILWGASFLSMGIALEYYSPFMLNFLTCSTVSLVLLPIINKPDISLQKLILLALTNNFFHNCTLFIAIWLGIDLISCIILIQSYVPFMYLICIIFQKKEFNVISIYGIIISVIGLIIVAGEGQVVQSYLPLGLVLLSSLSLAIYNVQLKYLGDFDNLSMHAYTNMIAGAISLAFSFIFESPKFSTISTMPPVVAVSVLIISVSTLSGFSLWNYLVQSYSFSRVLAFPLLIPIFGVSFVLFYYGYTLTEELKYGGALTLFGVLATIFPVNSLYVEEKQ